MTNKLSLKLFLSSLLIIFSMLFVKTPVLAAALEDVGMGAALKPLAPGKDEDIEAGSGDRWSLIKEALKKVEFTDRQEFLLADERTALTSVRGSRFYGYALEAIGTATGAVVAGLLANDSDEKTAEFWLSILTTGSSALSGLVMKSGGDYAEKAKEARRNIEELVDSTKKAVLGEVKRTGLVEGGLTDLEAGLTDLEAGYIRTRVIKHMERFAYADAGGLESFGSSLMFLCSSHRRTTPLDVDK